MPRATILTTAAGLAASPPHLFVGTSGWAYPTWKPGFYPVSVPARGFLHYYAANLTAVEVNYTFRALPTVAQITGWLEATPPGFRFSFKAPQRITHFQRLRDSTAAVAEFLAALVPVRETGKLGPLLFQLPPNFSADNARLRHFLAQSELRPWQIAFEFRNASWFTEDTYQLLRDHNAALCIAESNDLATPQVTTADFHYYRLRRDGGYSKAEMRATASDLLGLSAMQEVFAYLKHEDEPTGALNALELLAAANAGVPR